MNFGRKDEADTQVLSVDYFFGLLTRQNLNTVDYLRVAVVLAPQFVAGCLLYLMVLKRPDVSLVELLSVGSVLGIVTSTIVDQIFVNLQLPKIGWLVSNVMIVVAFVIFQMKKNIVLAAILCRTEFTTSILSVTAIAMTALGTEWFWLFPSGVLLVLAAFVSIIKTNRLSFIAISFLTGSALIVGIFMIISRPEIWWFLYEEDLPYLQALSHSLAERGMNNGFLVSGAAVKYHWFTYAWIGLVERASNATIFVVLTKVAPLVYVFLVTGLSWSFLERFSNNRLKTFIATLVVMNASSYPLWGYGAKITFLLSPSHFFATAMLFASVILIFDILRDSIRQPVLIILVMTAATLLSKLTHGAILVSAVCFVTIAQFFLSSADSVLKSRISTACIGSALLTYFLLMASPQGKSYFKIRFSDFYWQLQGDARRLPDQIIDLIGVLVVISLICLPGLLATASFSQTGLKKIQIINLFNIGSLVSGSILSIYLLGIYSENLYFLYTSISLSTLIGFAAILSDSLPRFTNRNWASLIATGVGLCFMSFLIPNLDSGSQIAIVLRSMRIYTPTSLVVLAMLYIFATKATDRQAIFTSLFKLVIVASSMAIAFSMYNWFRVMPEKHNEWRRNGVAYFASPNLIAMASWLNQNSNSDDIVASNFGWPKISGGEIGLFQVTCEQYHSKNHYTECSRTTNALFVAHVHRRAWLQATAYQGIFLSSEVNKRQTATLGFAANPTPLHLKQMLNDGVDWFVVDRSTTDHISWESFATMRYRNESFFVLQLKT